MLLNIDCEAISSVKVYLRYDDGTKKVRLVAINDLIDVIYNGNGERKRIVGRVADISTVGTDPHNWYIIVDGSDDFKGRQARFSPLAILDLEVIRKADQDHIIRSPLGDENVAFLKVTHGRLQYSQDGYCWHFIKIDDMDIIDANTPDPRPDVCPPPMPGPGPRPPRPMPPEEDSGIEDATY